MAAVTVLVPIAGAYAASVDAIDSVTISGTPPTKVGDRFRVDATWSVPDGSHAGDTFELRFPSVIQGFASTFDLKDSTGAVVGSCTGVDTKITCTLSSYVETHNNVHGSLYLYATILDNGVGTDDLIFTDSSSATFHVGLPAPIGPCVNCDSGGSPVVTDLYKNGNIYTPGGDLSWEFYVPAGKLLTSTGAPVTLTDVYEAGLTITGPVSVQAWPSTATGWVDLAQDVKGGAAGTYWLVQDPAQHSFQIGINGADTLAPETPIKVEYKTSVPAGTADGTVFHNSVSGSGLTDASAQVAYITLGGDGTGDNLTGGIDVSKVDAADSSVKLAGAVFKVLLAGGTKVADLGPTDAGGVASVTGLTPGVYQVVEVTAPTGYRLDATPIDVTVPSDGTNAQITVKNTASVPTQPEDHPSTHHTATHEPSPHQPSPHHGGILPDTGNQVSIGLLMAALILLAGGALVVRRSGQSARR